MAPENKLEASKASDLLSESIIFICNKYVSYSIPIQDRFVNLSQYQYYSNYMGKM
jgi:hypothetical protein